MVDPTLLECIGAAVTAIAMGVGGTLGTQKLRAVKNGKNGTKVNRDICDERTKHMAESLVRIEGQYQNILHVLLNGRLPRTEA